MYTDWYQLICRWWVFVVNWYLGLWVFYFHFHDYVEWDDFGFMILQIGEGKILPFNPKRNDQLRFIVEMIGDGLNKFLTPNVGPSILLPETTECCGKVWKILFANCLDKNLDDPTFCYTPLSNMEWSYYNKNNCGKCEFAIDHVFNVKTPIKELHQ